MASTNPLFTDGDVVTKDYQGPNRRASTDQEREDYKRQRRLKMEMLNQLGRKAILAAFMLSAFWVGRVERHLSTADEHMRTLATTVETVRSLASSVTKLQDAREVDTSFRTATLLELQKLNQQVELLRSESQSRAVRGMGRTP